MPQLTDPQICLIIMVLGGVKSTFFDEILVRARPNLEIINPERIEGYLWFNQNLALP